MGDYIRGVVVKLHVTPEQEVLFKQNYGCTRKTHNELLNKYKVKYGDSTKIPTKKELNQFLNESKKELPYLMETESTSLQQCDEIEPIICYTLLMKWCVLVQLIN